ncbi:MAG: ATP-binding cassette domain-containing protein [Baekduia sp.]
MPELMVEAKGLVKRYGPLTAVGGVDISVPRGTVTAILGPNGAGKTTTVRMLTTLSSIDEGTATVAGCDVATQPHAVRKRIGLTAQNATVDGLLTGRENLVMIGELHHLGREQARRRADELLEQFSLTEAGRRVDTYSGGMRRRIDLAATLVSRPPVLFLDEPTAGLDPRARRELWDVLDDLVESGVTILLTTQYLEEAERLADDIVVIDYGEVIARGTPNELKRILGGDQIQLVVRDPGRLAQATEILAGVAADGSKPHLDRETGATLVQTGGGVEALSRAAAALHAAGVEVDDLGIRQPTLDEVFLHLTGHGRTEGGTE